MYRIPDWLASVQRAALPYTHSDKTHAAHLSVTECDDYQLTFAQYNMDAHTAQGLWIGIRPFCWYR